VAAIFFYFFRHELKHNKGAKDLLILNKTITHHPSSLPGSLKNDHHICITSSSETTQ